MRIDSRWFVVLFVVSVANVELSADALRQCVDGRGNTAFTYGRSSVVFQGTAGKSRATGEICADCTNQVLTTFRVERIWKGEVKRDVEVLSDNSFETGRSYLVFAAGERPQTSVECGWSEIYAYARRKRDFLSGRPSRPPEP